MYAVVSAAMAAAAVTSLMCCAPPVMAAGGKPVMAEPGDRPTLPFTMEEPVDVIADPARMEKEAAAPSEMGSGFTAAAADETVQSAGSVTTSLMSVTAPLSASSWPLMTAPALAVMLV